MTDGEDVIAKWLTRLKEMVAREPGRYNSLAELVATLDRCRFDEVFELGLKSLIAGLGAQRAREQSIA